MASLRDIRKRIRSVKSTQQITRAMKMVSAAKLRRAQDAVVAARPYARALDQMIADLVSRSEGLSHPLLSVRPVRRVEIIALTSDRGLAGGFNANVVRRVARLAYETRGKALRITTVGRKGLEGFRRRHLDIRKDHPGLYARLSYPTARGLAEELTTEFLEDRVDEVFLVYNEFVSAITQRVVLTPLLPFQRPADQGEGEKAGNLRSLVDFEYEPSKQAVLDKLVPQAVAVRLYRALLESVASEHGARMTAMENATNNAEDAISRLTLNYNRTRQAAITKELMEIVSGAEALKS